MSVINGKEIYHYKYDINQNSSGWIIYELACRFMLMLLPSGFAVFSSIENSFLDKP